MATLLDETFATEIPAGFFTAYYEVNGSSSAPTYTYDSGSSAADLTKNEYHGYLKLNNSGTSNTLKIVMDVEILNNNTDGAVTSSGWGVGWKGSTESYLTGYFLFFKDTTLPNGNDPNINCGTGPAPYSYGVILNSSSAAFNVDNSGYYLPQSGRNTYTFTITNRFTDTADKKRESSMSVDGTLKLIHYYNQNNISANTDTFTPYIFIRGCSLRLHSIQVYDNPTSYNSGDASVIRDSLSTNYFNGSLLELSLNYKYNYVEYVSTFNFYFYINSKFVYPSANYSKILQTNYSNVSLYESAPYKVFNREYAGNNSITGTVKISPNIPTAAPVYLFLYGRYDMPIKYTYSNSIDGSYSFSGLDINKKFVVLSTDKTKTYNAVIADNVSPT